MPEEKYYYHACPLCQQDVDVSEPNCFRVLTLDSADAELIHETPRWERRVLKPYPRPVVLDMLMVGDFHLIKRRSYPSLEYIQRAWLLHTRCLDFVKDLPLPNLYLLLDLIEPTTVRMTSGSPSQCGAFRQRTDATVMSPSAIRLPREIWAIVEEYDIGRLLFLMKTALQLKTWDVGPFAVSKQRFKVERLTLKSDLIRIHLINIGGRTYIHRLSDPADTQNSLVESKRTSGLHDIDCRLDGSKYMAVKSDGVGVTDIAFSANKSSPEWVLHNHVPHARNGISKVKHANVQDLVIISDVWALHLQPPLKTEILTDILQSWKCRAIVPSNRTGAEPYFREPPFPPDSSWVDAGFPLITELSDPQFMDPFDSSVYFTEARYIPLAAMTSISMNYLTGGGIFDIQVNYSPNIPYEATINFSQPPRTLKFLRCRNSFSRELHREGPLLQVSTTY